MHLLVMTIVILIVRTVRALRYDTQSNESLLLDAVVSPESVELDGLVDFLDETTRPHRIQYKNVRKGTY